MHIVSYPTKARILKQQQQQQHRPEWYQQVCNDINSLAKLQYNWDGYNAMVIDKANIEVALSILDKMPKGIYPPNVVPGISGTLYFEWHCNDVSIILEFDNDIIELYLALKSENGKTFELCFENKINEVTWQLLIMYLAANNEEV